MREDTFVSVKEYLSDLCQMRDVGEHSRYVVVVAVSTSLWRVTVPFLRTLHTESEPGSVRVRFESHTHLVCFSDHSGSTACFSRQGTPPRDTRDSASWESAEVFSRAR